MPTKLEIKILNNIKHVNIKLEEQLARLDPSSEEYIKLLTKINKTIINFTKKLNICIDKKLLTDEEIINYKNLLFLQNIPNRVEEENIETD